jgi:segregation and condensation protein B
MSDDLVPQKEADVTEENLLDLQAVAEQLASKQYLDSEAEVAAEEKSGLPDGDAPETVSSESNSSDEEKAALETEDQSVAPELSASEIRAAVEALLFAADRPVSAAQMGRALPRGVNAQEVREALKTIKSQLADSDFPRGYELRQIAGGWQLFTRQDYADYVAKLRKTAAPRRLSGSALETLAVVAYKQPVTRSEVERIRGVACGDMLRNLMEKRLVKITGRGEELGNPLLYGTTKEFLNHFGLRSTSELPRSAELSRKPKTSANEQAGQETVPESKPAEWITENSTPQAVDVQECPEGSDKNSDLTSAQTTEEQEAVD